MDFDSIICYFFFVFSAFLAGLYFLAKKREFDFLLIYFLSMTLYFLPLFFGLVYDPVEKVYNPPSHMHYIVAGIASLGVFWGELLKSLSKIYMRFSPSAPIIADRIFNVSIFIFCLSLFISILPGLMAADNKNAMLDSGGFQLMLLSAFLPVGFISCIRTGDRLLAFLFLFTCVFMFLSGTRSVLVFLFISFLLLCFSGKPMVLLTKYRILLACVLGVFLVVAGKTFYGALMAGGVSGVMEWLSNFDFSKLWYGAEFLATGGILEGVIRNNFEIPDWVVPLSLLCFLPIPTSWLGFSSSIFNDIFQPALFPSVDYGMAYSPWAEAYSWLGLLGVLIYSVAIPSIVVTLDRLWNLNRRNAMGAVFLVMGVTLSFWIHRNSIGSEMAYLRNIFFPGLVFFMFSLIASALLVRKA